MALPASESRSASVQAMGDFVLKLPKDRFDYVIKLHPSLGVNFVCLLASRLNTGNTPGLGIEKTSAAEHAGASSQGESATNSDASKPAPRLLSLHSMRSKRFMGLILTAALCLVSTLLSSRTSLNQPQIALIEFVFAATVIWSLNIVPYHPVAVALAVFAVLFGIATPEKAFSGFSSPSWFMVLGIFAIAAAISRTWLLYRLVLLMIKRFPPPAISARPSDWDFQASCSRL